MIPALIMVWIVELKILLFVSLISERYGPPLDKTFTIFLIHDIVSVEKMSTNAPPPPPPAKRTMCKTSGRNHTKNILAIAPPASFRYSGVVCARCSIAVTSPDRDA